MAQALLDLAQLLLLPEEAEPSCTVAEWLTAARRNLDGFRPYPAVLRHAVTSEGTRVEVRRWTQETYLALDRPEGGQRLMLDPQARLVVASLERTRHLRRSPQELLYDEIYQFTPVADPTPEQLRTVQHAVLTHLHPVGYAAWDRLTRRQRQRLVSYPAQWEDAAQALGCVTCEETVETLELLMAGAARDELLEAASQGRLRPGPSVLAWLLARSDWNLSSGLVRMARSVAEDHPHEVWSLHRHPNPQVRLRLVDLVTEPADWVAWVAVESDTAVRERLRQVVERRSTPSDLVEVLVRESEPSRREALGWLLVHWSRRIESQGDWGALNRALRSGLGHENRTRLRKKLAQLGKLNMRSRWLG